MDIMIAYSKNMDRGITLLSALLLYLQFVQQKDNLTEHDLHTVKCANTKLK